jgi:hypothetical protein
MVATKTKCVPVEAHWSIGKVERGHATLRRAYEIIQEEIGSDISKEASLQMAVKALNDSTGPNGLVPTLLVFGAFPRISDSDVPAPSIQQRAVAIRKAMEEITKERAKRMVNNALNTRNGPNTEALHDLPPNSLVLVYREKGGWKGPFPLIGITGETCKVKLSSGVTDFRSTHVKLYYEESTVGDSDGDQSDREQVDEGDQSDRE